MKMLIFLVIDLRCYHTSVLTTHTTTPVLIMLRTAIIMEIAAIIMVIIATVVGAISVKQTDEAVQG